MHSTPSHSAVDPDVVELHWHRARRADGPGGAPLEPPGAAADQAAERARMGGSVSCMCSWGGWGNGWMDGMDAWCGGCAGARERVQQRAVVVVQMLLWWLCIGWASCS